MNPSKKEKEINQQKSNKKGFNIKELKAHIKNNNVWRWCQ